MPERKCYTMWRKWTGAGMAGGKVVWHTDDEVILLALRHSNLVLKDVPREEWPEMEKYMHQRVDEDIP